MGKKKVLFPRELNKSYSQGHFLTSNKNVPKTGQNLAKYPPKWKNRSRTPKIPPFHCVSAANAWASAHALSMVTWHHQNIVNGYHSIMFSHLFKAESGINDFILRSESSQNYLFFLIPKGINKLISKGIKEQAGAQMGQAQLKLGLGFTPTNLHH